MARQFTKPTAPTTRGTRYFRLKVAELTPWGEMVDRGYHNQSFATSDEAERASLVLESRAAKAGKRVRVHVVQFVVA